MHLLILVLLVLLAGLAIFTGIQLYRVLKPPSLHPSAFLKRMRDGKSRGEVVIACLGDSITHGSVSANYVEMLRDELHGRDVTVINGGINSEFAFNLLQRLDDVINCNPDIVTILIGTNDAQVLLDARRTKWAIRLQNLPRSPGLAWFEENLERIINRLQEETNAKLCVLSLPTIGENPATRWFEKGMKYSRAIKEIAGRTGIKYLPLHETMEKRLQKEPATPRHGFAVQGRLMIKSILLNRFGLPYSYISKRHGFRFHTDFLHLNKAGAEIITDLVMKFIRDVLDGG